MSTFVGVIAALIFVPSCFIAFQWLLRAASAGFKWCCVGVDDKDEPEYIVARTHFYATFGVYSLWCNAVYWSYWLFQWMTSK